MSLSRIAISNQLLAISSFRLLLTTYCLLLINFAEYFAAQFFLARLAACHHALGSGEDADPQPAQHARNLAVADVHPATRTRNALDLRNWRRTVSPVLQVHAQDLAAFFFRGLVVRDVAFVFQNAGHLHLQLGEGNVHLLVPRVDRVAYPRQKICDRIGQPHASYLLKSSPVSFPRTSRVRPCPTGGMSARERTSRDGLTSALLTGVAGSRAADGPSHGVTRTTSKRRGFLP